MSSNNNPSAHIPHIVNEFAIALEYIVEITGVELTDERRMAMLFAAYCDFIKSLALKPEHPKITVDWNSFLKRGEMKRE